MNPQDALRYTMNSQGRIIRLRYYTSTAGSVYDDDRIMTLSGTDLYISGLVQHVNPVQNSQEQILVEQGRIGIDDKKFFIAGSVAGTSGLRVFTIGISGLNEIYEPIIPGTINPQTKDNFVYQIIYGRLLPPGSLF